jgi:hypothetical protein
MVRGQVPGWDPTALVLLVVLPGGGHDEQALAGQHAALVECHPGRVEFLLGPGARA